MKMYKNYIYDNSEKLLSEIKSELQTEERHGIYKYTSNLTDSEHLDYRRQHNIINSIYCTVCKIFNIEDIGFCCAGDLIYFDLIVNIKGTVETVICSPKLSRKKLLVLEICELSEIIIELFLDKDNWPKELKYSILL